MHFSSKPFCPIDTTFFITDQDTKLNLIFLYYLLLHIDLKRILGDVGVPGLNREMAYKETALFPSKKSEQQKIAYILSTVQRAIEQQERIIQLTTELKKALMHKLFTQGLRGEPQKLTEIGSVPESWEIAKMGDFVNFQTGKLNSNAAKPNGAYPFFTCSQETYKIDDYAFDTEAILLSGNNARAIYSVKYYKGKFNAYQRTYVITLKDRDFLPYNFLLYILSQNLERLRTLSIGTSTKYLTLGLLKNLEVIIPKFEEAVLIGNHISLLDKKIDSHRNKKNSYNDLFRTLLHQLMTAQIRVHDIDFEALENP